MKKNSFKILAGLTFIVAATISKAQNVGINVSGATPSINAILDLNTGNSNNLGLIIPNVTLGASLATFNPPIANAATAGDVGMMVYNIGAPQPVGYYYWSGATWVSVSGAGATVTGANSGTSLNGTNVILGNAYGGTTGKLLANTEIPLNSFNIDFSGTGTIGIDLAPSTSAAQALEIGQTTNTIRVNGLKTGATFNTVLASASALVYANNANGDLYALPPPIAASVLTASAAGVLSWQNGVVPTGSGTLNYLARWTPSGAQLGIGITQDNGARVGIQTGVYGFAAGNLLQVTANGTDVSAIMGTTPQNTGYGVQGINTSASGTTSGVYGSSTSPTGFGVIGIDNVVNAVGVKGSNSSTTGTSLGVEGFIGAGVAPTTPAGVYGSEAANTVNLSGVMGVSTATSVAAYGVWGSSTSTPGYGVYGTNSNPAGIAIYGINTAADAAPGSAIGSGIVGVSSQSGFVQDASIIGYAKDANYFNTAIAGYGDYTWYNSSAGPAWGSGVFGEGLATGVYGASSNVFGEGTGVVGVASGAGLPVGVFNGQNFGVMGAMGSVNGAGVAGYSNSINTFPAAVTTAGVLGEANGTGTTLGVVGVNNNANGVGDAGLGNGIANLVIPGTGAGGAYTGNTMGAVGYAKSNGAGVGVVGVGNNIGVATVPATGAGGAFVGTPTGAVGYASSAGVGTGILGVGNNIAVATTSANGSGGAFDGVNFGSFSYASSAGAGTGVAGVGNAVAGIAVLAGGSGGAFSGTSFGLFAKSTNNANPSGAIECSNAATGNTVYVDYWNGTNYKILGTSPGTVSCSVLDTKGQSVVMHAPETPEAYYEDYGQGQLVNGKVHIDMDPTYAKNICVNDKHPLRVFIQLEGNCKGVYVTNKTATGFDVVELDGGTSNITFQYHIIGNQADAVMPSGAVSKFADLRFEAAPIPDKVITIDSKKSEVTTVAPAQEVVNKGTAAPVIEAPKPGQVAKIPADLVQKYYKGNANSATVPK